MAHRITRRTALKGLGTAVALPWLESLGFGAAPPAVAAAGAVPKRAAFFYVPNGVSMADWTPAEKGTLTKLTGILEPLNPYKDRVNVISGLALDKARANGDGPGDHARAMSAFLTGRQPRKTHGADIRAGQSADQHLATALGDHTRFPSLELGIEAGKQAGNCDSGYSCAYSANLSWRGESTPNAKETDPKAVFDRLFSGNDPKELKEARAKRELYNKSVLDFVAEDAKALDKTLGRGDKLKLDEYLTAVREVERGIEKVRLAKAAPAPKPGMPAPSGVPAERTDHYRLMFDLLVLAFRSDQTRVVTFPLADDGSNVPYKMVGVPDGHHDLSHHGRNPDKLGKIKKINTYHMEQFAYLLGKLRDAKEVDGSSLLDHVTMVYGSGIGDGDRHNHDDLPVLLVGGGGGTIQGGRHLVFDKKTDTPLMNLYLALFERMGAGTARFGDSTGVLPI